MTTAVLGTVILLETGVWGPCARVTCEAQARGKKGLRPETVAIRCGRCRGNRRKKRVRRTVVRVGGCRRAGQADRPTGGWAVATAVVGEAPGWWCVGGFNKLSLHRSPVTQQPPPAPIGVITALSCTVG
jgi:hypothetical protein